MSFKTNLDIDEVEFKLSTGDTVKLKDLVWLRKKAIQEGLIVGIESVHKGSTVLMLVLLANVDEDDKTVEMTYKEMSKQTGFSTEFIRRLLNDFVKYGIIKKLSHQGSSKTKMKLL